MIFIYVTASPMVVVCDKNTQLKNQWQSFFLVAAALNDQYNIDVRQFTQFYSMPFLYMYICSITIASLKNIYGNIIFHDVVVYIADLSWIDVVEVSRLNIKWNVWYIFCASKVNMYSYWYSTLFHKDKYVLFFNVFSDFVLLSYHYIVKILCVICNFGFIPSIICILYLKKIYIFLNYFNLPIILSYRYLWYLMSRRWSKSWQRKSKLWSFFVITIS